MCQNCELGSVWKLSKVSQEREIPSGADMELYTVENSFTHINSD